jgi:hypothetical protein
MHAGTSSSTNQCCAPTYVPDSIRLFMRWEVLCSPKLIENDLNIAVAAPKSSESTIRYKKNVDAPFHVAESQATRVLNECPYHDMSDFHIALKNPSLLVTPTAFKLSAIHLLTVDLRSS